MGTLSKITMEEITLPEFSRTKRVSQPLHAGISDAPDPTYLSSLTNISFTEIDFIIDFTNQVITWPCYATTRLDLSP
jgi:hypothetical protein